MNTTTDIEILLEEYFAADENTSRELMRTLKQKLEDAPQLLQKKVAADLLRSMENTQEVSDRQAYVANIISTTNEDINITLGIFRQLKLRNKDLRLPELHILAQHATPEQVLAMLDEGIFTVWDFTNMYRTIPFPSNLIVEIMTRADDMMQLAFGLKFIDDPLVLDSLIDSAETKFRRLAPDDRTKFIELATRYRRALGVELDIKQLSPLHREDIPNNILNQFILGLRPDSDQFFLAWSNRSIHRRHAEILNDTPYRGANPHTLSGGIIDLRYDYDRSRYTIKFHSWSGTFGVYSKRTLEMYHAQITDALKKALGTERVEILIEESNGY